MNAASVNTGGGGLGKKDKDELVAATPSQRNWKGIVISLLVICAVCGLIGFAIYLLRPPDDGPRVKGEKLSIDDIISTKYIPQPFNGTWISDNELVYLNQLGGLSILNAASLKARPIVANTTLRQLNAQKFAVSPDQRFVLLIHDERPVWERSTLAKYTVYEISTEDKTLLTPHGSLLNNGQRQPDLQWVGWGPRGNSLVFVYENDIYYKSEVRSNHTTRITKTGRPGLIYNGVPDWLYEAEVLHSDNAIWISPNGQYLVYASFNDTPVGEASYTWYADELPYPKLRTLRFPKAGTPIPEVTLWAVDLRSSSLPFIPFKPPDLVDFSDHYLTGVSWINDDSVVAVWSNRLQNMSVISRCRASRWICRQIYTVTIPDTSWLDFVEPPLFSFDGRSCLMRIPKRDGEAGHFRHIVWLDIESGREIPITHGPFEVTQIVAWDQSTQTIYFIAVPHGRPGQRHLYSTSEKSFNSTVMVPPLCITCPRGTSISELRKQGKKPSADHHYAHLEHTKDVLDGGELLPASTSPSSSSFASTSSYKSSSEGRKMMISYGTYSASITDMMVFNKTIRNSEYMNIQNQNSKNNSQSSSSASNISQPYSNRFVKKVMVKVPPCLYNKVIFSPNQRFFVRECLGPFVPYMTLHRAPLGNFILLLNNNTELRDRVAKLALPDMRTFFVETSGGYFAPVRLYLPPGLREEEEFKFPMVLHVDGGPGTQLVSEKWGLSWASYLASKNNYIVAEIDGRGTGFQGESIRGALYKTLGKLEVTDQLEVIHYLSKNLHFIDVENMAVYGWNYGGYLTMSILAFDKQNMFRCGAAIAPISKWEFLDSAYVEKFMSLPHFTYNYEGYKEADLTRLVPQLEGKNFLVVHGTADEKVHFQHTMYLTKALIKHNVSFSEQIYPDEGNKLKGVLPHLYSTIDAYFERVFDDLNWDDWEKATLFGLRMNKRY
ncbi:unnamed protein product [Orchesella dallaii]|uniref:Inactive dipeptidyl peptidase 10 n=1 Tax=Orchesella dallaii TaxID=48710 RepID=A0ABP1PPJ4_9HEXA